DFGAWRDCNDAEDRGRGVQIMRALARNVTVERSDHGTTVEITV
ncbi:MAG: ATP-binding protein, partial [Candidatus Eremiobacteraeota bacterium]|nr:ATP-binding protein [Candidatus Eremiobacteraeota bacterium]